MQSKKDKIMNERDEILAELAELDRQEQKKTKT